MENENKNNLILVPCDFSPLAFQATEHGALMAKAMNARLTILHVVAREAEIPAITAKLQFFVEECFESFGIRPETIVRHGEAPYSVIKEVAEEINPLRVILKTGGGIQTVKILAGTSIPFLVIQGPPNSEEIKNIVFPINFLNKLDEKMKRVVTFQRLLPQRRNAHYYSFWERNRKRKERFYRHKSDEQGFKRPKHKSQLHHARQDKKYSRNDFGKF